MIHWLHKNGNEKLLLFFHGWGMDDSLLADWPVPGFDVMTVFDYTEVAKLPDLSGYSELHLAAWSLGVRAAAEALAGTSYRFATATAFNGTLRPVDAEYGIDPAVFAGTVANWSDEKARDRFFRRLAGSSEFPRPERSWESQREELAALDVRFRMVPTLPNPFRAAWIGGRDRIIPAAAQRKFWKEADVPVTENAEAPHNLFAAFQSFEELANAEQN